MRRTAAHASLAVAVMLAVGACGSSSADYKNDPRPPGLIVITGYITLRFEFKMAVPTLIALVHDVFMTIGIYSLSGLAVTPGDPSGSNPR